MKRIVPGIVAATLVAVVAPLRAQDAAGTIRHPFVDSLATSLVGEATPGLAVLAIAGNRVVHRAAYGVGALGGETPVTLHTPFYIASTAKMFTAAAVLLLVDEGRIGLDDPLSRHLDLVPDYAAKVTVGQVLTHSSGLIDHYDVGGEERSYSERDVLEILAGADSLRFEPGTRSGYSNSGYVLLARLVARVTGASFESFLRDRFFEPLGMTDVVVAANGARPTARAVGHRSVPGGFVPWDYESSTLGAGGVYASLSDLERWYRGLAEGRVLSAEALQLASRPPELKGGARTPHGMGWLAEFAARGPLADRWYVFAFGSLRGFRAYFRWFQDEDALLVWMANSDSPVTFDTLGPVSDLLVLGAVPLNPRTPR